MSPSLPPVGGGFRVPTSHRGTHGAKGGICGVQLAGAGGGFCAGGAPSAKPSPRVLAGGSWAWQLAQLKLALKHFPPCSSHHWACAEVISLSVWSKPWSNYIFFGQFFSVVCKPELNFTSITQSSAGCSMLAQPGAGGVASCMVSAPHTEARLTRRAVRASLSATLQYAINIEVCVHFSLP